MERGLQKANYFNQLAEWVHASGCVPKKRRESQLVVLRTRYPSVHILQLASKNVSGGNGKNRGMFCRNSRQVSRQWDSSKHTKRRVED